MRASSVDEEAIMGMVVLVPPLLPPPHKQMVLEGEWGLVGKSPPIGSGALDRDPTVASSKDL